MSRRKINFRFAHPSAGVHDIAYHPDGRQILTCGADGFVRAADLKDPSADSPSIEQSNAINSISFSCFGEQFAIGTEDHKVELYSFPSLSFSSLLTRFTLPVHHVVFSPSGSLVAAAGDEGTIKIVTVGDTSQVTVVKGHQGPVLSLSFDPKGKFLASSSTDSSIIIWDITSGVNKLTSIPITKVQAGDPSLAYQRLRLSWDHDGKYLAIPGDKDVQIIERDTWKTAFTLKDVHSSPVSLTAWSPSGRYLATVDLESKIVIWDILSKDHLEAYTHESVVTGVAWNPIGNGIVVIDVMGKQGTWDNIIPHTFPHPASGIQGDIKQNMAVAAMIQSEIQEAEAEAAAAADAAENDSDEEEDSGVGRRRLKKRIADDDEEAVIDDDVQMDDEGDKKKDRKKERLEKFERRERFIAPQAHAPVQPGATPEGRKRRFLAYNMIGAIATRDEEGFASVEIEFADTTFHNKISISDHHMFSLAALSEQGAVFACRASLDTADGEETQVNSTIMFRPFNSWTRSEWTLQLPNEEDVLCLGISKQFILVATSMHFLRVFTHGGTQHSILSLPGAPVSIAADGDVAAIVYNAFPGLELMMINLKDGTTHYEGGLPISPNSTLTWIGFSQTGMVCTNDSRGILRGLANVWKYAAAPPRWVPLVDFRNDDSYKDGDTHWVVGLTETQAMCVFCIGESCPQVIPRPSLSVYDLSIPIIRRDNTLSTLEEKCMRTSLTLNGEYRQAIDKGETPNLDTAIAALDSDYIRLIHAACKKDLQAMAYDVSTLLSLRKSLTIAMKLAHNERRNALKEKMEDVVNAFENKETKAEQDVQTQQYRDRVLQELQTNYDSVLSSLSHLQATQAAQALVGNSSNTERESEKIEKKEKENKGAKLRALAAASNGHNKYNKDESDNEDNEDKEDVPAKYESPYESAEEEEDEEEEKKEKKVEKEEEEEKEEEDKKSVKEDSDNEEEEKEEEEEAEEEKKKTTKKTSTKKAAGKKAAPKETKAKGSKTKDDDKKTKGKKSPAKKSPAKSVDPSKARNPFALAKKPATTPKGQPTEDEEEKGKDKDRKRKEPADKTSPAPKKAKQAKVDKK